MKLPVNPIYPDEVSRKTAEFQRASDVSNVPAVYLTSAFPSFLY
jgi:hypothetical protein